VKSRSVAQVEQLTSLGTRPLLYIVPTFQNPTGRTLPLDRRRQLLETTRRHGVTVIEDGPYNALRDIDRRPDPGWNLRTGRCHQARLA
jgi:DNA-binding transcriptional MocR family regulator